MSPHLPSEIHPLFSSKLNQLMAPLLPLCLPPRFRLLGNINTSVSPKVH